MSVRNLRSWLKKSPVPSAVVVDKTKIFQVPTGPRKWAELEESIIATEPSVIECVDAANKTIRATTWGDEDGERQEQDETVVETDDVWAIRMAALGGVMERCIEKAFACAATQTRDTMTAMAQMTTSSLARAEIAERAASELRVREAEARAEAIESASGGGDVASTLMQSMMAGQQARAQAQPQKQINGKAKENGA